MDEKTITRLNTFTYNVCTKLLIIKVIVTCHFLTNIKKTDDAYLCLESEQSHYCEAIFEIKIKLRKKAERKQQRKTKTERERNKLDIETIKFELNLFFISYTFSISRSKAF